jgi:peptidoglycan/LPS O-acetylase OafA/YrhL
MKQPDAPPAAPTLYEKFRRVRFFSSLDGLRAFSIIAVIWHHAAASAVPAGIGFLHRGNRGVTLFFAISAFLISTLLLRAKEKGGIDVPRFLARRALRILPLFYAVLGVYITFVIFVEPDRQAAGDFLHNLPAFATFTSNWFVSLDSPRVIFYFAWTLAAEEQFYLCWPWAERYLSHVRAVALAVGVLIASQLIGFVFAGNYAGYLPLKIIASVPAAILFGVILAHVLDTRRGFMWMASFAGRRGSAIVALLLVIAALNAEGALGFAGELLTSFSVALLVATCVIREDNDLAPVLRLKPIAWIGTVSYGIYLMHMLSVGAARRALAHSGIVSPYADFFFGALLSIGVASLSYLTYEKFFLRLKDRLFSEAPVRAPVASTPARSIPTGVPAR